eukprot:1596251-Pyramimonas_sp.AAC.2
MCLTTLTTGVLNATRTPVPLDNGERPAVSHGLWTMEPCEPAPHLVPEGRIQGVVRYGHELDGVVAQLLHTRQHLRAASFPPAPPSGSAGSAHKCAGA